MKMEQTRWETTHRLLAIAPLQLDIAPRKKRAVGLWSYIVNAQAGCADCYSCPT